MVPYLVNLGNIYKVILYKISFSCYFIIFPYFFSTNLITILSFFSNLSSFNHLALSMPALGLYVNFYNEVLYFLYCGLLGNLKYPLLAYYLATLLLNIV